MAEATDSTQGQTRSRGADLSTLIVAALAAVVAAFVTSKLWSSGALISTAMTPVIVSLVKEYMQRPVEKIGAVARVPLVAARATPQAVPAGPRSSPPPEAERRGHVLEPAVPDPDEYEALDTLVPPGEEGATETPYRVYRKRPRARTWWRVGLATGMLAFLVAVVVITVPELVGGGSVGGGGGTTLFNHHSATDTTKGSDKAKKSTDDQGKTSSPSTKSSQQGQGSSSSSSKSGQGDSDSAQPGTSSGGQAQPGTSSSSGSTATTPESSGGASTQTAPTTTAPTTSSTPTTPPAAGDTQP